MGARIIINIGDKFGYLKVVSEIEPHITPCGTIRRRIDEYGYTIAEALGFEIHNKKQYDRNNKQKKILQNANF